MCGLHAHRDQKRASGVFVLSFLLSESGGGGGGDSGGGDDATGIYIYVAYAKEKSWAPGGME